MSMVEIVPDEPYVFSTRLAAKIAEVIDGVDADRLLAAVPELLAIDEALNAIEAVWNDLYYAADDQSITDFSDEDQREASMNILADAFKRVTGEDPREYGVSWDPEAGPEPEDDEGEEE